MIHSTAIIHPTAQTGCRRQCRPYSIIGEQVNDRCRHPGRCPRGHRALDRNPGADNQIFQFASVVRHPRTSSTKGKKPGWCSATATGSASLPPLHRGHARWRWPHGGRQRQPVHGLFPRRPRLPGHNRVVHGQCCHPGGHVEVEDKRDSRRTDGCSPVLPVGCHTMISAIDDSPGHPALYHCPG